MADTRKYIYPPRPASGAGTFSDNIVGLQTVDGGGLTQGNFEFTTGIAEKVNRTFDIGSFSEPISLDTLQIDHTAESRAIIEKQYKVYPKFNTTQILNFTLYGSLAKRLEVSITKIINWFPGALDFTNLNSGYTTGNTAINISYDSVSNETYFEVVLAQAKNPFDIDYTPSAATAINSVVNDVSPLRNFYSNYFKYVLDINGTTYPIVDIVAPQTMSGPTLGLYILGQPFNSSTTIDRFLIRPSDSVVDQVFKQDFDEVEQFLLNRLSNPIYTAFFQVPTESPTGQFYTKAQTVIWPLDGPWNILIEGTAFDTYLETVSEIAAQLDTTRTDYITRSLITDAFREFDTEDRRIEKVLQIYGRSFDEIKKYIDGLSFVNSVHYNPSNDIPSELLKNLAETIGWDTNISPIQNDDLKDAIFGNTNTITYSGYSRALTPEEINAQYFRNLILNSAYIFKSKGTPRSILALMKMIGAPDSLIDFTESVYLADQKVDMTTFESNYSQITGGTYVEQLPSLDSQVTFKLQGQTYTGFGITNIVQEVDTSLRDYPIDVNGYPKAPISTDEFFFEKGAGWYETTPAHISPDEVVITGQVFTGQNPDIQSQLEPFTYGQKYFDRFRKFPYMKEGFKLQRVVDNKKSWVENETVGLGTLRIGRNAGYNAYYYTSDEKLVLNAKNIDLFLNAGQGLAYDVWRMSTNYNFPIPSSGVTSSTVRTGDTDWTVIDPQPSKLTFFEFQETFWKNMIDVRNRQYITDGKTGGYPRLYSMYWNYLQSQELAGLTNNNYNYQNLIEYIQGIGDFWPQLVKQMIAATTIWNTGERLENSIFHRQKVDWPRQRGCELVPVPADQCFGTGNIFAYDCSTEFVETFIYPWLNSSSSLTSFSEILLNRLTNFANTNGLTLSDCLQNSLKTTWYIDVRIGNDVLVYVPYYYGFGIDDVPSNQTYKEALQNNLSTLNDYGFTYFMNGNTLRVTNLDCIPSNLENDFTINTTIGLEISCC
jgi:hypothetical protein